MMLYCELKQDGTLLIRATEGVEMYALAQWEKQHKVGKATLEIQVEKMSNATEGLQNFLKALGKDLEGFRKWQNEQKSSFMVLKELTTFEGVSD